MKFDDLNLVPGNALQLQFKFNSDSREKSYLIGYRSGRSILITTPELSNGAPRAIKVGEELNVRLFAEATNSAAAFSTQVTHVSIVPYPHLHLAYPTILNTDEVRKAARVSTTLKSSVKCGNNTIDATIVDLSTTGCRIESETTLGDAGSQITVMTRIKVANTSRLFPLPAEIKTIIDRETSQSNFTYGLAFQKMPEEVSLVLHAYVYYQLHN